jgi:glycosyltransferase involved in cell wall biosynthesis
VLSDSLRKEGFLVYQTSSKINKIARLLDMLWQLFQKKNQVDLVLMDTYSTQNFYYALFCSQFARVFNIPYINILHGGNLPNRLNKNPFLSRLIFKNAKALVAPSHYLKTEFEQSEYPVQFIPNSVIIDDYPFKNRTQFHAQLLWVRAFDKSYNPTMAIEVLKLLINTYPEAKLCMVGPIKDTSFSETKLLVKKYGLENKVVFTGVLSKTAWHQLSQEYDIFINTTDVDNTPVSVIEAMALGLPVVSTNVGGMPFLINHEVDGILVDANDANAMANAIEKRIENRIKTMEITKYARQKVVNFDWNLVKYQWIKLLNDV